MISKAPSRMLYDDADISKGVERKPVKASNRYTYDALESFNYISDLQLSEEFRHELQQKKCSVENDSSSKCSVWNEQFLCRPILAFHVYFVNPQKRWGVRCETQIAKDTCLGEYGGILRKDNGENNPDNNYLFSFHHESQNFIIDALESGNNHSCNPNLTPRVVVDNENVPHVVFYARHNIVAGEELTFNYGPLWWKVNSELKCVCEVTNCDYKNRSERNSGNGKDETSPAAQKVILPDAVKKPCEE